MKFAVSLYGGIALLVLGLFGGGRSAAQAISQLSGVITFSGQSSKSGEVHADRLQVKDGRTVLTRGCQAAVRDDGTYKCSGMAPGRYLISVEVEGEAAKPSICTTTFYPGTCSMRDSAYVQLVAGIESFANITTALGRSHLIQGTVSGIAPRAVRIAVYANPSEGIGPYVPVKANIEAHDGGSWAIKSLGTGWFLIRADWVEGGLPAHASMAVFIDGSDVAGISLQDQSQQIIRGKFSVEPGFKSPQSIDIHAIERDFSSSMRLGPYGDFTFASIVPGRYWLSLSGGGDSTAEVVTVNGHDSDGDSIDVELEQDLAIEVRAKHASSTLEGFVAKPSGEACNAVVVLRSDSSKRLVATSANAECGFSVSGLEPGQYQVYAFNLNDIVAFREIDLTHKFPNQGKSVMVYQGATRKGIRIPEALPSW